MAQNHKDYHIKQILVVVFLISALVFFASAYNPFISNNIVYQKTINLKSLTQNISIVNLTNLTPGTYNINYSIRYFSLIFIYPKNNSYSDIFLYNNSSVNIPQNEGNVTVALDYFDNQTGKNENITIERR